MLNGWLSQIRRRTLLVSAIRPTITRGTGSSQFDRAGIFGRIQYGEFMKPLEMPSCDDRLLWDTYMSVYHLPTLVAADDLGLFSLLNREPATVDEVAKGLSLGPRAAEALLGVM